MIGGFHRNVTEPLRKPVPSGAEGCRCHQDVAPMSFYLLGRPVLSRGMSNILVVEDEPDLASLIAFNLKRANFDVEIASNGERALEVASHRPPHLVVLDLMLPDISGVEVCKQLKQSTSTSYVPVL